MRSGWVGRSIVAAAVAWSVAAGIPAGASAASKSPVVATDKGPVRG